MEKILYEHVIKEAVSEPGFDGNTAATLGAAVPPSAEGATYTADVAQQTAPVLLAKNTISKSLPYMIGLVQNLTGPSGYVFGLQYRSKTGIDPARPNLGDDVVVIRKFLETEIREVILDLTNETAQDILALFGSEFPSMYDKFIQSGGEIWKHNADPSPPSGPLSKFFLRVAMQKMTGKINDDFVTWLETVATLKGSTTITNWAEMDKVLGIISELRESLAKQTHKSGRVWALVSPRIAGYLSTVLGSQQYSDANVFERGKREATNVENGFVATMGNLDIYQYDFLGGVTGGSSGTTESTGEIFMGFAGGPGTASIYYTPYSEAIIQSGADFQSGQSNVIYRVRDTWSTNPLDSYNITDVDNPVIELSSTDPILKTNKKSQFVVKSTITFSENLIA